MRAFLVKVGKILMKIVYFIFKVFPVRNKILFLSRQSNLIPLDFELLMQRLKGKYSVVVICQRVEKTKDYLKHPIKMIHNLLRTMYNLATSKVCIIDSYSLPVSVLKHKKSLTIIQIWHAMGKIKKSGYQTLDKKCGRTTKVAKLLNMHNNYDYVISGSEFWNKAYSESFGVSVDILRNYGLPRCEYIYKNKENLKKDIYRKHPGLKKKKTILYAPTYRKNNSGDVQKIIDSIDLNKYNLIVRSHPNQKLVFDNKRVYRCNDVNIYELLTVCDYLITDYSSLVIEAAAIDVKLYFYLYDYNDYKVKNGINFDPSLYLPKITFFDPKELIKDLESNKYDSKILSEFKKMYIPTKFYNSIDNIVKLINKEMNKNV